MSANNLTFNGWSCNTANYDSSGAESVRYIRDHAHRYVAQINWEPFFDVGERTDEDGEAVARLISSAPQMFSILEDLVRWNPGTDNHTIALSVAAAFIKSMTGE